MESLVTVDFNGNRSIDFPDPIKFFPITIFGIPSSQFSLQELQRIPILILQSSYAHKISQFSNYESIFAKLSILTKTTRLLRPQHITAGLGFGVNFLGGGAKIYKNRNSNLTVDEDLRNARRHVHRLEKRFHIAARGQRRNVGRNGEHRTPDETEKKTDFENRRHRAKSEPQNFADITPRTRTCTSRCNFWRPNFFF